MDTSTDYMTALNMPMGVFLECYQTLTFISDQRNEEMKKSMDAIKNQK
jgi:hypothetical protein